MNDRMVAPARPRARPSPADVSLHLRVDSSGSRPLRNPADGEGYRGDRPRVGLAPHRQPEGSGAMNTFSETSAPISDSGLERARPGGSPTADSPGWRRAGSSTSPGRTLEHAAVDLGRSGRRRRSGERVARRPPTGCFRSSSCRADFVVRDRSCAISDRGAVGFSTRGSRYRGAPDRPSEKRCRLPRLGRPPASSG